MKKLLKNWHLIVLVLFGLTPLVWYLGRGNVLINGVDTNFPLDPLIWFKRRFFVWDSIVNGGRDFSSSTSGFFFHLIQVIPFSLGIGLKQTQIISVLFWFFAVVFSAFIFSKTIVPKSKHAQVIFTVFYAFNIYIFNTWENIKVANLSLMVSLPILLSVVYLFIQKKIDIKKLSLYFIIASLFVSGTGINPSYFIALMFAVILFWLIFLIFDSKNRKHNAIGAVVGTLVLILMQLYWILPLLNYLFFSKSPASLEDLGLTNWVNSLSENTSLVNVMRLQGAWDWYVADEAGSPTYIPYAINYFNRLVFILFSFLLPILSSLSLMIREKKKNILYLFFGITLLLGIFLGAGTHPPTGTLYSFLLTKVPFFSFFRSPWYIFTPYVVLSYSGLSALFLSHLLERWGNKKVYKISADVLFKLIAIVIIIGNLFYSYPLVTGKIFRPKRSDSFFVTFPSYVGEAQKWLKSDTSSGRIITYPDDDLESFNWGYRGTESILGLFSNKEYISPSFNIDNKNFKELLGKFYKNLKVGNYQAASLMMPVFGADTIFVKSDASTHSPSIDTNKLGNISKSVNSFGEWTFFKLNDSATKVYSPKNIYLNLSASDPTVFPSVMGSLKNDFAVVDSNDSQLNKFPQLKSELPIFKVADNVSFDEEPTGNIQKYKIEVDRKKSYYVVVERNGIDAKDINLLSFPSIKKEINEDTVVFGPITLEKGEHVFDVSFPTSKNIVTATDYSKYYSESDLRKEDAPADPSKTLVVKSGEDGTRITITTTGFNPFLNYQLTFSHKFFYGHSPIVDVLQYTEKTPLKVFATIAGDSFDWENFTKLITPANINSNLDVVIRVPSVNSGDKSKSYIENISIKRVYDNNLYLVEELARPSIENTPNLTVEKINPTKYKVRADGVVGDYILVFSESYSPSWNLKINNKFGAPVHFSVNGYANAWYIPGNQNSQEMIISYKSQSLYYLGILVVLSTVIVDLFIYKRHEK